jgi:periplasmic protein CpxP/Spy
MNLKNSRGALLALGIGMGLALGLIPAISGAQTAPRQLPANPQADQAPPPPAQSNRADPRGFDRRANRFDERLDRRLDFLHAELRITPAQEQVWATFADAVRREAREGRDQYFDRRGGDAFRGGPDGRYERPGIVERLERRQQGLEERGAYYERLLNALRPLYGALSEEQRRAADEHLFSPGREDRRFGPRRFGMDRDFGRFRPRFDRPYGPPDRPYDRFDRAYP